MPSQTDTALHIEGLTWALGRLGAVCVGETLCSGPQRQKPNVKGWFPLVGRVFGFPSKESGGGVGNPQSALGNWASSVPPTCCLPQHSALLSKILNVFICYPVHDSLTVFMYVLCSELS